MNRIASFISRTALGRSLASIDAASNLMMLAYDRMGRRVTKGNQRFVYDGYLQVAENQTIANQTIKQFFTWGPTEKIATRPLVWLRGESAAYYTHDGNKNVSEVVAANGTIAAHYEYAPFGALTAQRGESAAANPWRFSSEYAENETGTIYYNYRHYEPGAGRWMARDPIGELGGRNLLQFCRNSSQVFFDYVGLFDKDKCRKLMEQIQKLVDLFNKELEKYDPIRDGEGGLPYKHTRGSETRSGTTKPGGHYEKIKNYQRGLKKELSRWKDVCSNGPEQCPPIVYPTWADELSNQSIPEPVIPDPATIEDLSEEGPGFWAEAAAAAGAGAATALILGNLGPQAFAPEEIVTVPIGAVTGFVAGGIGFFFH